MGAESDLTETMDFTAYRGTCVCVVPPVSAVVMLETGEAAVPSVLVTVATNRYRVKGRRSLTRREVLSPVLKLRLAVLLETVSWKERRTPLGRSGGSHSARTSVAATSVSSTSRKNSGTVGVRV